MWKLISTPKTYRVTKKLATEFATMDPCPRDRPLSERRCEVYRKVAAAHGFRPVLWAKANVIETGGEYRVNGKHTSTVFAGLDPMPELYATIEHYSCDTLEDLARLYSTYDSKIQSRSVADINRSFVSCIEELNDLSMKTVNKVISGISYNKFGEKSSSMQPMDRAEEIFDNIKFALWVDRIFGANSELSYLLRVPVVAAMHATFNKSMIDATVFWQAVRDETGEKPGLPDRKIARFLLTHRSRRASREAPKKEHVADRAFYVKCLHAWNAWRRKETSNLNYYADSPVPTVI
jgi:hypothetical protein